MYLFSNIIGTFVFNQNFEIREKILFKENELHKVNELLQKGEILDSEKEFLEKFKNIVNLRKKPDEKDLEKIYSKLEVYKDAFYKNNLLVTKSQIRDAISEDLLIIQASSSIEEINKAINLLVKRLREWYSYILPEVEEKIQDHTFFVENILEKSRKELIKELRIENSMGLELEKQDNDAIIHLAKTIHTLAQEKVAKENYLEQLMKKNCPNINEVAGYLIGAKLIALAGSLRSLILLPSSTVQLLGAEKALFRHMLNKKNAKPPKHGVIHEHPLLQKASREYKGKVARALADKILLAAKIDYFKGEYIGGKLKKDLEEKFEGK